MITLQNQQSVKYPPVIPINRLLMCLLLIIPLSTLANAENRDREKKAIEIIQRIEDMYRGTSSYAEFSMTIQTPHWQRTMSMEAWSKGLDNSFIRIISPKKEAGITTLKINNEMWNFFPKINKTIKVPPSMMMGSWMGSDFTNDDLVRESRLTEDYRLTLIEEARTYTITLIPKENTATVWAKITIVVNKYTLHPQSQTYHDESGTAVRVLEYSNLQHYNGTELPSTMTMTPLNKNQHRTTVTYITLNLGSEVDDSLFSLRNLKKRNR